MINFLCSRFAESATSPTVSEDEYPPSNLISRDVVKQRLGFMAYRVTKPPVEVEFTFIINADVQHIRIWNSSGTFKSTGFEIYAKCGEEFVKVGSASNLTCDLLTFYRNKDHTFADTSLLETHSEPFFNTKSTNSALSSVRCLKVVIKSTKKSPPLIRKIEVWGLPAKDVDKREFEQILNIWTRVCPQVVEVPDDDTDDEDDEKEKSEDATSKKTTKHPEEFLDALTYELMVFPMTLPSGKVVDQATIKKHTATEEKWGRPPSDPFTGQEFIADRKPVFDAALKSRIDKYLLENSHLEDVKKLARAPGKRPITIERATIQTAPEDSPKQFKIDIQAELNFGSQTDLRELVRSAIESVRRYSSAAPSSSTTPPASCFKCKGSNLLYTISKCSHVVCKVCIKDFIKQQKCHCGESFKTADISRLHT